MKKQIKVAIFKQQKQALVLATLLFLPAFIFANNTPNQTLPFVKSNTIIAGFEYLTTSSALQEHHLDTIFVREDEVVFYYSSEIQKNFILNNVQKPEFQRFKISEHKPVVNYIAKNSAQSDISFVERSSLKFQNLPSSSNILLRFMAKDKVIPRHDNQKLGIFFYKPSFFSGFEKATLTPFDKTVNPSRNRLNFVLFSRPPPRV